MNWILYFFLFSATVGVKLNARLRVVVDGVNPLLEWFHNGSMEVFALRV